MVGDLLIYLALGACAGTLAGLFGIGGGLIIVPVLIFCFQVQGFESGIITHLALGTSLATIVFTSVSSVRSHHAQGAVRWDLFRPMALGIVLGAALGVYTAAALSGLALQNIIGVFAILVAIQMGFGFKPKPSRQEPGMAGLVSGGGVIGWASAIFGIGGGTLTVPFLTWHNVRMQQAVATSAACGMPIAIAGAMTNVQAGWGNASLPEWALGFVYLPALMGIALTSVPFARLGARLAHKLSAGMLKRVFAVLLLVVGIRFLLAAQ